MKDVLKPFTKQTGEIIRFSEIFINRKSGEIKHTYREFSVLLSNSENIVYLNKWNKLGLLDQKKLKKRDGYNSHYIINDIHVYEQKLNMKCFEDSDGLYAHCFSFASKRINDRRVKTALRKYLDKEFSVYSRAKTALDTFKF